MQGAIKRILRKCHGARERNKYGHHLADWRFGQFQNWLNQTHVIIVTTVNVH